MDLEVGCESSSRVSFGDVFLPLRNLQEKETQQLQGGPLPAISRVITPVIVVITPLTHL